MDPLTTAYFSFGVFTALLEMPDNVDPVAEQYGGELHFVRECLTHGDCWLTDHIKQLAEDNGMVFVYEVAQIFGFKVAEYLIDSDRAPLKEETLQYWLEELLK